MGLSGWILTKERINDIDSFKDDIMMILERFTCECHAYEENDEYFISIVENNDEYGVSMYASDYDTIQEIPFCDDQDYYCAIYIEKLGDDEQLNMLLEFMYYYLKKYPDHVFFHYGGIDCFFTKSDIDTIYERGNWQDWCFLQSPPKQINEHP